MGLILSPITVNNTVLRAVLTLYGNGLAMKIEVHIARSVHLPQGIIKPSIFIFEFNAVSLVDPVGKPHIRAVLHNVLQIRIIIVQITMPVPHGNTVLRAELIIQADVKIVSLIRGCGMPDPLGPLLRGKILVKEVVGLEVAVGQVECQMPGQSLPEFQAAVVSHKIVFRQVMVSDPAKGILQFQAGPARIDVQQHTGRDGCDKITFLIIFVQKDIVIVLPLNAYLGGNPDPVSFGR